MYHLSFLFDFIHMSSTDGGGKIKRRIFVRKAFYFPFANYFPPLLQDSFSVEFFSLRAFSFPSFKY